MRKITVTRFDKTPRETLDYDFIFDDWVASKAGAVITGFEASADPGVTIEAQVRAGGVVKLFISGGVAGQTYNVSVVLIATLSGNTLRRELQAQIFVYN